MLSSLVDDNTGKNEELENLVTSNSVGLPEGISNIDGISEDDGRSLGGIDWNGFIDRDGKLEVVGRSIGSNDAVGHIEVVYNYVGP